jgi:glycosyltransferase involved in cell wall biosynthesis
MKKDIIFIGGIDWYGKYKYSTHHIVERLLINNRVFYIDNFGGRRDLQLSDIARVARKIGSIFKFREQPAERAIGGAPNLFVVQSLLIPTPRFPKTAGRFNRFMLSRKLKSIIRRYGIHDPVIWNFVPTDVVWDCLSGIQHGALIYQSVDNFAQHPLIPEPVRQRFLKFEKLFTQSADLVFANARNLHAEKIKVNSNTHFFPNGVHPDLFQGEAPHIHSMHMIPKPIVGFAGLVGPWIDFELLAECASKRPDWSFVLIGAVSSGISVQQLSDLPNVHFTGPVDHSSLGPYFKYFDAGIIPYRLTEFTRYTFPSKMAEYLAAGLPVISTALPEVEPYSPEVSIVRDPGQMITAIERALDDAGNADRIESRLQMAQSLSWDTIVGQMEKLIDEIVRDKL